MPLKLKPTSVIKANLGIQPNGPVHAYFTNACYRYMDKYVPKREGNLRNNVDIQTDKIIYESEPYAEIQYYGIIRGNQIPEENYTTPGTGPYWDKRMWSAEGQDVVKEVQDFINRGGK